MADAEELLEDIGQMEARIVIEELLENQTREQLLLQEAQGKYPEWNKMSDERLMKALHTLRDEAISPFKKQSLPEDVTPLRVIAAFV